MLKRNRGLLEKRSIGKDGVPVLISTLTLLVKNKVSMDMGKGQTPSLEGIFM